ncbi:MAG: ATP-binding protein, partial [Pseudomonadota bacterium]
QRLRYRARLSGPLLDRIDIGVTMPRVSFDVLTGPPDGDTSSTVRERVVAARERALARQGCTNGVAAADILLPTLEVAATRLLRSAASQLTLSARHCHRVLRAARSIADLADTDSIHEQHMAEALSLRLGLEEGSSGP